MLKSIISTIGTKAAVAIAGAVAVTAAAVITAVVVLSGGESYRVLKVFELNGSAAITRESAGELDAYVGMNLESGDVVTVNSGTMRLSLDNNKYILLEEGTVLELVADGTAADSKTTLNLREGAILNEITEPLSTNSLYEVNAPKSTMAVRGTSFYVSARQLDDGSYTIDVTTFHGKVSTQLFDENGNEKGGEIIVGENKSVEIMTENTGSGHPENDGIAYYVITDNETGELRPVADGETPTYDTVYVDVPEEILDMVLGSDDSNLLKLSESVLAAIRGLSEEAEDEEPVETTAAATTTTTTTTTTAATTTTTQATTTNRYVVISGEPRLEALESSSTTATSTRVLNVYDAISIANTTTAVKIENEKGYKVTKASVGVADTFPEIVTFIPKTTTPTTTTEATTTTAKATTTTTTPAETTTTTTTTTTAKITRPPVVNTTTPAETTTTTTESVPETVNVIFDYGDTSEILPVTAGEAVGTLPAVPEREGHTGKWVIISDDGAETELTADMEVLSDTTVKLSYTPIEYTIEYIAAYDESVVIATKKIAYGEAISRIEIPDEYMAVDTDGDGILDVMVWGWDEAEIPEKVMESETIAVPYAEYSQIVEIRIDAGAGYVSTLYEAGSEYTLPTEPTNKAQKEADGYIFKCWTSESGEVESSAKAGRTSFSSIGFDKKGGDTFTLYEGDDYSISATYVLIDRVEISGAGQSVGKGESAELTAEYSDLSGDETFTAYSGDIAWSISGVGADGGEVTLNTGTTISADGLLTVASDETATSVKVTATSARFNKTGTETIIISG